MPWTAPPGVSVAANIQAALDFKKTLETLVANGSIDGTQMVNVEIMYLISQFWTRMPQDYKQRGEQYREFGNFNFGAAASALGIDPETVLQGAGAASFLNYLKHRKWDPHGTPWSGPPYGDDPMEQQEITNGISYFNAWQNGCVNYH